MQFAFVCIVICGKLHCLITVQLKGFAKTSNSKTKVNCIQKAHKWQALGAPLAGPCYILRKQIAVTFPANNVCGFGCIAFASFAVAVFASFGLWAFASFGCN